MSGVRIRNESAPTVPTGHILLYGDPVPRAETGVAEGTSREPEAAGALDPIRSRTFGGAASTGWGQGETGQGTGARRGSETAWCHTSLCGGKKC